MKLEKLFLEPDFQENKLLAISGLAHNLYLWIRSVFDTYTYLYLYMYLFIFFLRKMILKNYFFYKNQFINKII